MRVQIVKGFRPDQPCMWQIVAPNANPDYCVQVRAVLCLHARCVRQRLTVDARSLPAPRAGRLQLVKRNPDFTVKYVKSFPGVAIAED